MQSSVKYYENASTHAILMATSEPAFGWGEDRAGNPPYEAQSKGQ